MRQCETYKQTHSQQKLFNVKFFIHTIRKSQLIINKQKFHFIWTTQCISYGFAWCSLFFYLSDYDSDFESDSDSDSDFDSESDSDSDSDSDSIFFLPSYFHTSIVNWIT